jgi:cell division transport system permease protein
MAQAGKASLKRGKPNYIYTVVGVALVLLIMGIMGWFFLNLNAVGNTFKEDIRLSAYMRTLNKDTIAQIQQYIAGKPYAKNVVYVDKNTAKEIWKILFASHSSILLRFYHRAMRIWYPLQP